MTQKTHSAARGLASLGRYGDSTLVHMSPEEVRGLQNLAIQHGTSLTINPHTGLPEAFSLKSLLPTLGGLALGIVAPWSLPYAAIGTAGAMKASGKDWGESLLTGLQVYGGGALAKGLGAAGAATKAGTNVTLTPNAATNVAANAAPSAVPVASNVATDAVSQTANQLVANVPGATVMPAPIPAPTDAISQAANNLTTSVPGGSAVANPYVVQTPVNTFANTGVTAPTSSTLPSQTFTNIRTPTDIDLSTVGGGPTPTSVSVNTSTVSPNLSKPLTDTQLEAGKEAYMSGSGTAGDRAGDVWRGTKGVFDSSNKAVTFGNTWNNLNTPAQIGLGTGVASAFVEKPKPKTDPNGEPLYYIRDESNTPLYSFGTVNPNVAELGYIPQGESYFEGAGFNPGVYSASPYEYKKPRNMREGGNVGIRHLLGGGQLPQDTSKDIIANSGTAPQAPQATPNQVATQIGNEYFRNQAMNAPSRPMLQAAPSPQAMNDYMAQTDRMIAPAPPSQPRQTLGSYPQLATNLPLAANKYDFEYALKKARGNIGEFDTIIRKSAGQPYYTSKGVVYPSGDPSQYWQSGVKPASYEDLAQKYRYQMYLNNYIRQMREGGDIDEDERKNLAMHAARQIHYFPFKSGGSTHSSGLANLSNTYKAGGKLLRGPGDGMSDSIPAVIGGHKPQRAALADGEFVVPADVVSHLGNGSTEAGSRKLYAMMAKVRHARTGRKKQAPAIKAEKFMPK